MRFGFCCLLLLANLVFVLLLPGCQTDGTVVWSPADVAAPPLTRNEQVVKTRDGCGMVVASDVGKGYFSDTAWGGACVDGLAMGEGVVFPRVAIGNGIYDESARGWAWYGRRFGGVDYRYSDGSARHMFRWDGKPMSYNSMDPTQVTWFEPRVRNDKFGSRFSRNYHVSDGDTTVRAYTERYTLVHGVSVGEKRFPCPKHQSSEGCDALWAQHANPVIEHIRAFLAENEPKAAARRKEAEQLAAEWREHVGPKVVARVAAKAQYLNEQTTRCSELEESARDAYFADNNLVRSEKRFGKALKQIFSGDCAWHPKAETLLAEADKRLVWAAEAQSAEDVANIKARWAREQQEAEEPSAFWQALGTVVTTTATTYQQYQTTKNALEQQQTAQAQAQAQAQADAQARAQAQAQSHPTSQAAPQSTYSQRQTQPQSPSAPQADPANTPNAQQVQREYAAHMQQVEQRDAANAAVSHCIEPSSVTSYGGFINKCGFKVDFVYCTTGSTGEGLSNFSDAMDCRNPRGFGSSVVAANGSQANLTAGAKGVYWAACREPYHPTEYRFSGSGITFRCIK